MPPTNLRPLREQFYVSPDFFIDDNEWFTSDQALASPLLMRNIAQKVTEDIQVTFRASPFGAMPPPIPVAKTATLARIASPSLTDKSLQSPLFNSLKQHFLKAKRLVKKGDVFAVVAENNVENTTTDEGEETYNFYVSSSCVPDPFYALCQYLP